MGKIVTFYSYKGGVGQSMTLANIATLLTRWGYRTLILDWNLEAPGGVAQFFAGNTVSGNIPTKEGILELLSSAAGSANPEGQLAGEMKRTPCDETSTTTAKWKDCLVSLDLSVGDSLQGEGELELLGAGRWDAAEYFPRLQAFDVGGFYASGVGGQYIERLRTQWKSAYDFVLVDCRSGITPFGSICTIQLPDILVLLLPSNEHGLRGTINVAKQVTKARHRLPFDRVELLTVPIPARFDLETSAIGYEHQDRWFARFEEGVAQFYEDWLPKNVLKHDILADTLIPYQPKTNFDDELLPSLRRQVPARTGVAKGYESLAALLANNLEEANRLHTDREGYVNQAWKNLSLPRIMSLHEEWLRTKGTYGKRANLTDRDYRGLTLVNAHLSKALFVNTDLRSTNFLGANVIEANFSGANLEKANLKELKGARANFGRASLREASLVRADLQGANFQAASLNRADLEDANLYRATLKKASLEDVTGLTIKQFRGVDLSGAQLPERLRDFRSLREARSRSRLDRALFYLLGMFCIYTSYIVLLKADGMALLTNRSLGPLAAGIGAVSFFVSAPVVLLLLYILFLVVIQRLWDNLVELPATFPDGLTLNEKISDWFTAAVAYPYLGGPVGAAPNWRRLSLSFVMRGLVPFVQVLFWWKVLPLRNWRLTSFEVVSIALTVAFGWSYKRRGARTLRTNNTGEHWQKEQQEGEFRIAA